MFPTLRPSGSSDPAQAAEGLAARPTAPGPTATPLRGGALQALPTRPAGPSVAKRQFLEAGRHPSIHDGRTLTWKEIGVLARHYAGKAQARIHLCGDSDPRIFATAQGQWLDARKTELAALDACPDQAFALLRRYWDDARPRLQASAGVMLGPGAIYKEGEHAAIRAHLESCPQMAAWLEGRLHQERQALPRRALAIGPSAAQASAEMGRLARDGSRDHRGYLFAAHSDLERGGHVDTYVITSRGESIRVIPHESLQAAPEPDKLFHADPWHFMTPRKATCPQASGVGCATLGLSYLKEYLKDDAHQLNHFTSMVVHRPAGGDPAVPPVRFHLPSPQVLRYSQSAFYAKLMAAMVSGRDAHAEVVHQGSSFKVLTLRGILRAGGEVRRPLDGHGMKEDALDAFAGPWMEAFEQTMRKRDTMVVQSGAGRREANLYLTYATHRLGGKADRAGGAGQGGPAGAPD
jgi:hypothetical protein